MIAFWAKVEKTDGCWLWRGSRDPDGYGNYHLPGSGKARRAHRLSYELTFGAIPEGTRVLHRCDVPRCVNPGHLYIGSDADNATDRHRRSRTARGSRNGRSKLTEQSVGEILGYLSRGRLSQEQVAKRFSVSLAVIRDIESGKTWKHVERPENRSAFIPHRDRTSGRYAAKVSNSE